MGRIRAEDEDLATVPFLASDNEEEDDDKTATGRYSWPWSKYIKGVFVAEFELNHIIILVILFILFRYKIICPYHQQACGIWLGISTDAANLAHLYVSLYLGSQTSEAIN